MELNIEAAVRVHPINYNNSNLICVQSNPINNTIQLGNAQNYPVTYALPNDCCQNTVFTTTITPLLGYLLEGCDVSIVTFGQSGTGKTYTLYGPGFHFASSEAEHGIIPRFIREVFTKIKQYRDRHTTIHITWSQIAGDNVRDLLGGGSVECTNITEVFHLIQLGMSNIGQKGAHTLFTLTLEQQWFSEGLIQHRISTASFADLAGGEKVLVYDSNGMMQTIPTDPGLQALQRCIMSLSDSYQFNNNIIPYGQSVLTTLLKDSFGGRAKTLLICCLSPLIQDFSETLYCLQLALRAQIVKNFVTVNSYTTYDYPQDNYDIFGLQFAANQLFKLVANAEELFQKLVSNGSLPKNEQEQISQWLTLKQECEECLSENSEPHRSLERIEEEDVEDTSDSGSNNSEDEDEIIEDDPQLVLDNKLQDLIDQFRLKTDKLVTKASSNDLNINSSIKESIGSSNNEYHMKGARGRRTSIHSLDEFPSLSLESLMICDLEDNPIRLKKFQKSNNTESNNSSNKLGTNKSLILIKSNTSLDDEDLECLRHEIRNLRKTRDYLLEQRCNIDLKSQNKKILNDIEERKLLQYEEAIEAIDLAIEYKNQVICGREPLTDKVEEEQVEEGNHMLMERLLKLSENEMRLLLYKYFEKIIDLRSSSKKLEMHVQTVENQNEDLVNRVVTLSDTLRNVRLKFENKIVPLQKPHKDKSRLMLSPLAEGADNDNRLGSRVAGRSKQAALTLQIAGAAGKQFDKSLIAKIAKYTSRQETVPRQLQAASPVPQAKVTRQKNKIFIQQTKND